MKIAAGLSGGVDSSVAALLLKEAGHEVTGITMKLWNGRYKGWEKNACFGAGQENDIDDAAAFARAIGIDYKVFDCSEYYDREIVTYFRESYLAGRTPNPCVRCNAALKFGLLPEMAARSGLVFDKFATGHYARIEEKNGRFALMRASDKSKDHSSFRYRLSQDQLSRTMFPCGDKTKVQIREIAAAHGLSAAVKPDSQDFYSGDTDELIGREARPGDIVDVHGKKLGRHTGFWHYTIGQRKGLGIGGGTPYYVIDVDACSNRVVVGSAADAVRTSFRVEDVNWVSSAPVDGEIKVRVKVRSAGEPRGPAFFKNGVCTVQQGIAGVAPGQSAVFYAEDSDEVVCGGVIVKEEN